MLFHVHIQVKLPHDLGEAARAELLAREAARGREMIAAGQIKRIWRVAGKFENISLYEVKDADELHACLTSLPAFPYLTVAVTPLCNHPLTVDRPL